MADPKSRARVERLLSGILRQDDLTHLFLYARFHCDNRETVADIGHFIAHQDERDRGITTRSIREWFASAQYILAPMCPGDRPHFDARALPHTAPAFFRISVNRLNGETLKKETGLRRAKAHSMMVDLAARLTENPDGTWALPPCSQAEIELVQYVSNRLIVRPAFTGERLLDEFLLTLKSNGLISKEEIRANYTLLDGAITLYAVASMHQSRVLLEDGSTVELTAHADTESGNISVLTGVPMMVNGSHYITVMSPIFIVGKDPLLHCTEELIKTGEWHFPIELAEDLRLARIA